MLGGVCGGLAAGLGADAALLRVLLVALTLVTGGAAAIVYVAAWVLAPEDDRPALLTDSSQGGSPPLRPGDGSPSRVGTARWSTVTVRLMLVHSK